MVIFRARHFVTRGVAAVLRVVVGRGHRGDEQRALIPLSAGIRESRRRRHRLELDAGHSFRPDPTY